MKIQYSLAAVCMLFSINVSAAEGVAYSKTDFVGACMASTNMGRSNCDCLADEAHKKLSPNGFSFLVAMLKGEKETVEMLRGKLAFTEMMDAGMFMTNHPARCGAKIKGAK